MSAMRRKWKRTAMPALALLVLAGVSLATAGCARDTVTREDVERIDDSFRRGSSRLAETTAFMGCLERFDFENAAFLQDVRAGIEAGRTACAELRASMDELLTLAYPGELEELGRVVEEYASAMGEAVGELEVVYGGLEEILLALEPILREEASVTQLEAPRSDVEFMGRLQRLDAALAESLSSLERLAPPPLLREYRDYFEQLLGVLGKLVDDLIAVTQGLIPNVDVEHNPDFLLFQQLLSTYPSLVEGLSSKLKVAGIDPLMERVELEINRLYLENSG
ncbi:MAG: hypothetical protein H5T74_10020 [Actinobacteria bacterium]|nr:hypothetical protein [Actinomycetota bacterium]